MYVIVGGDDEFPSNFIKALSTPILAGEAVQTMPGKVIALNKGYWGKGNTEPNTVFDMKDARRTLFYGVLADYFRIHINTDPSLTFYDSHEGVESLIVDADLYIHTPDTLPEIFRRERWLGEQRLRVVRNPVSGPEHPIRDYMKDGLVSLLVWFPIVGMGILFYRSRRWRMPFPYVAIRSLGFLVGIILKRD